MYERNTRVGEVTCRECNTVFMHETRSNRPKLLCDDCLRESQRKATREHKRKRRASVPRQQRTCLDCPADLTQEHGKVLRCEDCRNEKAREYQRLLRAANPKPTAIFYCVVCEAAIDRVGNSGRPKYCSKHRTVVKRSYVRCTTPRRPAVKKNTWYTHCYYCQEELPEPRRSLRSPARCESCKRQWHYAYMRARTTANRPTISECRDCRRPVELKRKGRKSIRCESCAEASKRARWLKYAEVYRHMRRAWKYAAGYEKFSPMEIYERDGWRCGVCRKQISRRLRHPNPMSVSLDHKISLSRGGPHSRMNTQPAHLRCNIRKNKYDALPGEQMPLPIVF